MAMFKSLRKQDIPQTKKKSTLNDIFNNMVHEKWDSGNPNSIRDPDQRPIPRVFHKTT